MNKNLFDLDIEEFIPKVSNYESEEHYKARKLAAKKSSTAVFVDNLLLKNKMLEIAREYQEYIKNIENLKPNEFICCMCHKVYEKAWTDEEAKKEAINNFGIELATQDYQCIVCDDCYTKIDPLKNLDKIEKAKNEFISNKNNG